MHGSMNKLLFTKLYFSKRKSKYYMNKYRANNFENRFIICTFRLHSKRLPTYHFPVGIYIYLVKRSWNPGFLWLLILSQITSFLKISLNFLKSFRRYEEILCQYQLFSSIFLNFSDFLTLPSYKETNDISL